MEFKQPAKKCKLDFTRPTFNEPLIELPPIREERNNHRRVERVPSSFADDEASMVDSKNYEPCVTRDSDSPKDISVPKASDENVSVFLRVRPTSSEQCDLYKFDYENSKVIIPQTSTTTASTEKHFSFTDIMNEDVDQIGIYDKIVRPILDSPFDIRGATFAGYGVSNSGKTYTILGESSAGLVPRAITQIFTEYGSQISEYPCVRILNDKVDILSDDQVMQEVDIVEDFLKESRKQFKGKSRPWSYENIIKEHNFHHLESAANFNRIFIWVSLIEIYNEKITDLLNNQKGTHRQLKIFSNAGNSYVHGATWLYVKNVKEAFEILNHGLNKVAVAATGINTRSSRSHTIFTINIVAEITFGVEFQLSSFKFCDLAGAERLKKTGNVGKHLKEAGGINSSLLVLGRCLESVFHNQSKTNKKQHDVVIPVRDSKLTLLIQSSLAGHEKFVMIVNLLPNAEFFDENLNVLKFGSIANQIVVKKAELRKFKRQSTRYSFFNNEMSSPVKNASFNGSYLSYIDESELDDSYRLNSLTPEELRHYIQTQRLEIGVLRKAIEEKERETLINERLLRNQLVTAQEEIREKLKSRNEESQTLLKQYHEKKLESQKIRYERLLDEAYAEIKSLEKELSKLKKDEPEKENDLNHELEDEIFEIDSGDDDDDDVYEDNS